MIFQRNSSSVHLPRGKAIDSLDKSNLFRLLQFINKNPLRSGNRKPIENPNISFLKDSNHTSCFIGGVLHPNQFFGIFHHSQYLVLVARIFFQHLHLSPKDRRVVICDGISSSQQFRWARGSCKTSCNSRL